MSLAGYYCEYRDIELKVNSDNTFPCILQSVQKHSKFRFSIIVKILDYTLVLLYYCTNDNLIYINVHFLYLCTFFKNYVHFLYLCTFLYVLIKYTFLYKFTFFVLMYEGSFNQTDNFFYFITKLRFFKNFNS